MRALAIVVLLLPAIARAESEAERLYNKGQQAYDTLRYDDAVTAWEGSYALSKLPALLFNIAQAQRLRATPGDCTRATANYKKFIDLSPKAGQRDQAAVFITELASCVAAEARPAPTPAPQPGPAVVPPPKETPSSTTGSGKRLAGLGAGGVGIALVVTGVVFGAKARRLGNEVDAECADGCDWVLVKDKDASGRSAQTAQFVFYGIGGAAIATGAILYWLGAKERAPRVSVVPRGDAAIVTWSGSWGATSMVKLLAIVVAFAGCTYGASFDDCQVRSCRGPSDCPGGFTCDGDGFCRAPGASVSCSEILVDGAITGEDGGGPGCSGAVTACTTFVNNPTCVDQTGCGWVNPTCTVKTNCSMFMTNQACMNEPECVTDFTSSTCVRRTNYCAGGTKTECESDPVCGFGGGCSGAADACSAFTMENACVDQAGCRWN